MDDQNGNPIAEDKPLESQTEQNQDGEQSPEELEWSKLGGGSQERFRQLIRERNTYKFQAEQARNIQTLPTPQVPVVPDKNSTDEMSPEELIAIENLRTKYGFWTKKDQEEFERKQQEALESNQRETQDEVLIETEYSRLETVHNGSDGLPPFDRTLIEEHMRATGVYNPEKAYEDLYRDEIFDAYAKEYGGGSTTTYSEKPHSVSQGSEPLTIDGLRERLRQPDGKQWWDKNRDRLLPMVGELMK
jgi:hypothetical protein